MEPNRHLAGMWRPRSHVVGQYQRQGRAALQSGADRYRRRVFTIWASRSDRRSV